MDSLVSRYLLFILVNNAYTYITAGFATIYFLGIVDLLSLGFILSIYTLIQFILEYPTGSLTDTHGERAVFITGTLIFALSLFIEASASNPAWLLTGIVVGGFGITLQSGCLVTWFNNTYRDKYKEDQVRIRSMNRIYGKLSTVSTISISFFIAIGGWLTSFLKMSDVFLIAGLLCLIMAIVGLVGLSPTSLKRRNPLLEKSSYIKNLKEGIELYFKQGSLFRYSVYYAVFYSCLASFATIILQPALQETGMKIELIALLISGGIVFMAVGSWFNDKLKTTINRYRNEDSAAISVVSILQVVPFLLYYHGILIGSLVSLVSASILFYVLWGAFGPIFGEVFQRKITNEYRARFISIHYALTSLGLAIGYTAVGILAGFTGYTNFILVLALAICVLVTLFLVSSNEQGQVKSVPAMA
ncbi:MAG: MFS transporter [Candidatus Odinarchaeota archaeon]